MRFSILIALTAFVSVFAISKNTYCALFFEKTIEDASYTDQQFAGIIVNGKTIPSIVGVYKKEQVTPNGATVMIVSRRILPEPPGDDIGLSWRFYNEDPPSPPFRRINDYHVGEIRIGYDNTRKCADVLHFPDANSDAKMQTEQSNADQTQSDDVETYDLDRSSIQDPHDDSDKIDNRYVIIPYVPTDPKDVGQCVLGHYIESCQARSTDKPSETNMDVDREKSSTHSKLCPVKVQLFALTPNPYWGKDKGEIE